MRRYTGLVPLMAPGLAVALAPIAGLPVVCALLAFVLLRYDVAVDTLRSVPGDPAPVPRVFAEMRDGLAADTYSVVEPVAPGVAARMMAAYTGQPVVGREPVRIDLAQEWVSRLPVRARNLSAPAEHDGRACRWVRGDEARIFVPVAVAAPLVVTVTAAPADADRATTIEVVVERDAARRASDGRGLGRASVRRPRRGRPFRNERASSCASPVRATALARSVARRPWRL